MAKRLNKNLVVTLTIVGMALTTAAGVILVMNLPQKSPKMFVDEAEKALAKDPPEYSQASTYYQRAAGRAKAAKDDALANTYLIKAGDLALSAGDPNRAMGLWNTVVIADPSQLEAQEKIVTFSLELARLTRNGEWWARLETQARKLVDTAQKDGTKSYLGLHALGCALDARRDVKETNQEEGKKCLIEAVNGDKANPEYARSLSNYYLFEAVDEKALSPDAESIKNALAVLDAAVASAPADPEIKAKAHLYRGQFYATPAAAKIFPDADQLALADLQEAARLAPQNEDTVVGLGVFWHGKKISALRSKDQVPPERIEEYRQKAREQYEAAIRADPDRFLGYLQLAGLYLEEARYDDALKVLDQRLDRPVKRERSDHWRSRQYMLNARETAFKANMAKYTQVLQTAATPEEGKKAGAPILERLDQLYKNTLAENGEDDPEVQFMQGRLLLLRDEYHAAVKALKRAEELTSGDTPEIQRFLAMLYSRTGAAGAAEAALDIVLANEQYRNDPVSLTLQANVKNQLEKPQEALVAADKALGLDPGNREALRAKMQACLQQKNYPCVEQMSAILNQGATGSQDAFLKAMLLRQEAMSAEPRDEGKLEQAAGMLRQILEREPANYPVLIQLVGILSLKPERFPEAKQAIETTRQSVEREMTEIAATQPASARVRDLGRELINLDLMLVTIDPAIAPEDKIKRKEEIVRRDKDPFVVAHTLYQLYRGEPSREKDAEAQLKEAYRLRPEDPVVLESMLQMAIDHKDWPLAEEIADKAVAVGVEKSGGHMYRGMIWLARTDRPNNFAEAEREFRAALVEVPDFADGYAQLGRALLAQNRVDNARTAFEKAYQLNPRNVYAPVGLAIIADSQQQDAEKQKWLAIAQRVAPNNQYVMQQMQNQEDLRDPKKGIARREDIRKGNPSNLENLIRLADLYTREQNFDAADKVYQAAMEVAPSNLNLAGMYARFLAGKTPADIPAARAMLRKVVDGIDAGQPERKATAQILYASFLGSLAAAGLPDAPPLKEIDEAYLAAVPIAPVMGVQTEVASYFLDTGRPADALRWYREARASAERANRKDQRRAAHQLIVQTLLQTASPETFEETRREIEAYRQQYPEDAVGNMMQAELDIASGHEPQAVKQLSEYIARMPQNPLGYLKRGAAYFRRSEWESAIKDLRAAKQLEPRYMNGQPRLLLARALEQSRQPDAAVTELQSLTQDMPESGDAAEQLFRLYVRLKRYDSAESLINARSQQAPRSPFWSNLRRIVAMERKDYGAALQHAIATVELSNYSPPALDSLLTLLLQLNRFDELIAYVDQKLPAAHRKDAVLIRQASAYLGKRDVNKAIELYLKAVSTPPVDVLLLADFLSKDAQFAAHQAALQHELESMWEKGRKDRDIRLLLSSVRRARGQFAAAAEVLRDVMTAAGTETPEKAIEQIDVTRAMATLLYEARQWNESKELYLKVLEKSPNDPVALNNLAYLLMDQLNSPQEALAYSQRANAVIRDGTPQKSSVLDTIGWNLVLLGRFDEAISRLGRSIEIDPGIASVHYHLAEALYGRGQKAPSDVAQPDLDQARKEVQAAHALLVQTGTDPENVRERLNALAARLNVTLAATPATQAAR